MANFYTSNEIQHEISNYAVIEFLNNTNLVFTNCSYGHSGKFIVGLETPDNTCAINEKTVLFYLSYSSWSDPTKKVEIRRDVETYKNIDGEVKKHTETTVIRTLYEIAQNRDGYVYTDDIDTAENAIAIHDKRFSEKTNRFEKSAERYLTAGTATYNKFYDMACKELGKQLKYGSAISVSKTLAKVYGTQRTQLTIKCVYRNKLHILTRLAARS